MDKDIDYCFFIFLKKFLSDDGCKKTPRKLSPQEVGIAKLSGFGEWFSNHCPIRETDDDTSSDVGSGFQKTIIFAHHLKVLDGIQVSVTMIV